MAGTACGVGLFGLGIGVYSESANAIKPLAIRPPGALAEEDFLGACIRCGLCVRDCPYDTLHLAKLGDTVTTGTPYFVARQIPCEMCEDIPCVTACPTGALDHNLVDIDQARMGLAVVIDQEGCIAFQGLRCEVCYNVCPIQDKAISLETRHNARTGMHAAQVPIVHSDACTGCGKCEQACILTGESAIKIIPIHLAQSGGSPHYRLGWEEKDKAGQALVTPDVQHQFNLPEGLDYDYAGKGLIDKAKKPDSSAVPFADNPLDTLNHKGGL
jgi:ferredoxin-type protein NapG